MHLYTRRSQSVDTHAEAFLVATPMLSLAVTVAGDAITEIRLGATAPRLPATTLERGVAEQLAQYLAGSRSMFTVPTDPAGTPFQQAVWETALCHSLRANPNVRRGRGRRRQSRRSESSGNGQSPQSHPARDSLPSGGRCGRKAWRIRRRAATEAPTASARSNADAIIRMISSLI